MQIQIHTDHNIAGRSALADRFSSVVEEALSRFSVGVASPLENRLTHVDVYLSDQNSSQKDGYDNMQCTIEARLEGHQPLAVTDRATTLNQAVDGAAEKVALSIEHTLGRLEHQASHRTDPPLS